MFDRFASSHSRAVRSDPLYCLCSLLALLACHSSAMGQARLNQPSLPSIAKSGPPSEKGVPGMSDLEILQVLGYESVKQFQSAHGLVTDGIIGQKTRRALLAEWEDRDTARNRDPAESVDMKTKLVNRGDAQEFLTADRLPAKPRHALSALRDLYYESVGSWNGITFSDRAIYIIFVMVVGILLYILLFSIVPKNIRTNKTTCSMSVAFLLYLLIGGTLYQVVYIYDLSMSGQSYVVSRGLLVFPFIAYAIFSVAIALFSFRSLSLLVLICLALAWGHLLLREQLVEKVQIGGLTSEEYEMIFYWPTRFVTIVGASAFTLMACERRKSVAAR